MLGKSGASVFTPEEVEHLNHVEQQHGARWAAVNKPKEFDPEPGRVVSDIDGDMALKTSAARLSSLLASNPKIKAAQSEWEKKNQSQSQSRPSSTGPPGIPSLKPPPPQRKRESPASDVAAPAAKRQNSEFDVGQARREALRFTEDEVARQMSELSNTSIKATMIPRTQTARFATGNELLKRYTGQGTPPTPVPPPVQATTTQTAQKLPAVGERIVAITIAEGTRPYSAYQHPEQGLISARGAIIPPKYELHNDPQLQYICPVRDCRRLFKGLQGLGGHFGAGHCSTTFNDNGDGTLSKVGNYQKNGPGGTPGIVVSRNPLPPGAPPPVDPGLSLFASSQQNRVSRAEQSIIRKTTRAQETPVFPPVPLVRSNTSDSDVKSFLHKYLSPDQTEYHREDVDFILSLPRMRDLTEEWKQGHSGKTLDMNHYACALAYLTGRVVTGTEQCTANTARPTARLSTLCIALPAGMPTSAKQAFSSLETCVGCRYWCILQRRSNSCDWCPSPQPRQRTSGGSARSSSSEDVTPAMDVDKEEELEQPIVGTVTETIHDTKRSKRRLSVHTPMETMGEQSRAGIPSRPDQMGGVELEMEDWEVAPGRMKDHSSSDNIAFSNSYLTSGQPVTVSEDISFNVIVLKPGTSSHWNVDDDKLRTCSVAAGKVRVTMGEQTFNLGPNGMFVIRPGQACRVANRLYLDSVVHCTTICDFGLQ
ncbi:unnamed protein product [Fusarium langsethiae]|nr:unnamed protein product [Fusarium langsethiae]